MFNAIRKAWNSRFTTPSVPTQRGGRALALLAAADAERAARIDAADAELAAMMDKQHAENQRNAANRARQIEATESAAKHATRRDDLARDIALRGAIAYDPNPLETARRAYNLADALLAEGRLRYIDHRNQVLQALNRKADVP